MVRMTHLGGPTVLLELGGWRILTDPTFDPPGRSYGFGWGTSSTKTAGPALQPEEIEPVDLLLLSHDHHADNLDNRGRALLPAASTVLTTRPGARRLAAGNVRGLAAGETTLEANGREPLTVRATPCRHGPPLSKPIAGSVIGFALSLGDEVRTALWMTGDTVLHRPVRRLACELRVDVLLLHLGAVRFPITGPLRYPMNSRDAIRLIGLLRPRVAVPVHYDGWSHFSEPTQHLRATLDRTDPKTRDRVMWLELGRPGEL